MTVSRLKIPGAAALACVLVLGGMQPFGGSGAARGSREPARGVRDTAGSQATPINPMVEPAQAARKLAEAIHAPTPSSAHPEEG